MRLSYAVAAVAIATMSGLVPAASPATAALAPAGPTSLGGAADTSTIAVSPDGSTLFATGEATDASGTQEWATAAFSTATGAQLWLAAYTGDRIESIAVSPDGSKVFVTGWDNAYDTVAYDAATGAQLWAASYSAANIYDQAASVAVSPDGTQVFVTGASEEAAGTNPMFATVAYQAATGAMSWVARYALGPRQAAGDVAVSADGSTVYVAGTLHVKGNHQDFATVAYDAATGASRWVTFYPRDAGTMIGNGSLTSMTVSPDGSTVFVTGQSEATGVYGYATVAYDAATGAQLWASRVDGWGPVALPSSMAVSPDGSNVFVTGYAEEPDTPGTDACATVAYRAATGARLWPMLYGRSGCQASGVVVSPDGSQTFITGSHGTVAYDAATGAKLWSVPAM